MAQGKGSHGINSSSGLRGNLALQFNFWIVHHLNLVYLAHGFSKNIIHIDIVFSRCLWEVVDHFLLVDLEKGCILVCVSDLYSKLCCSLILGLLEIP